MNTQQGWQPPHPPAVPQWHPSPAPQRSRWIRWTVAGTVLVLAVGVLAAVVAVVAVPNSDDLADAALTDAAGWPGITVTGVVSAPGSRAADVELTLVDGEIAGTLRRDDGGRAEIVHDGRGTVLRANREWWLERHESTADQLAGVWVLEPTEQNMIESIAEITPENLRSSMQLDTPYRPERDVRDDQLDGVDVLVAEAGYGQRTLYVSDDGQRRLVAVELGTFGPAQEPLRVARADEAAVDRVRGAAVAVRDAESPRTVRQKTSERPEMKIRFLAAPACTTTCEATVEVSNSGTGRMVGALVVTADGLPAGEYPLNVAPGARVTVAVRTTAPADSGQPVRWNARTVENR